MTTEPTDLSVERIDAHIAMLERQEGSIVFGGPWALDKYFAISLAKQARRCAVAEASMANYTKGYNICLKERNELEAERDSLRDQVAKLTTQLHEEGERATRLQDELDKGNDATPDRRFEAACASLTGLRAHHGEHSQELHGEDLRRVAIKDADALLARLATPPARAEGKEPK